MRFPATTTSVLAVAGGMFVATAQGGSVLYVDDDAPPGGTRGPGCFNLGSRFDLAANRIMDSTIGGGSNRSPRFGEAGPRGRFSFAERLHNLALAPEEESR